MKTELLSSYLDLYGEPFLEKYAKEDTNKLRFSLIPKCKNESEREVLEFALLQIEARRKFGSKLSCIMELVPDFIFPSMIAGEQASNTLVSRYHSEVIKSLPGYPFKYLIDISSGLGIDFISIVNNCDMEPKNCHAIELDSLKCAVLKHNVAHINCKDVNIHNEDSIHYLSGRIKNFENTGKDKYEVTESTIIFADPARRSETNARLYDPADCLPDVLSNIQLLKSNADTILIKYSPMLDIARLVETFDNIRYIHIVSVKNECKEVLVEITKDSTFQGIKILNITDKEELLLIPADEWHSVRGVRYITSTELYDLMKSDKELFLYEPNVGLMKAGAWGFISSKYKNLLKADMNTHLFCSTDYYEQFPGRVTRIRNIVEKKDRKKLKGIKTNVVCRNYPMTPDKLINEYKLKSSPDDSIFLYAFTLDGIPTLLATEKITTIPG